MNHLPLWIAAPLVAICMNAQAETISLESTPCGAVRNCNNIANSAGKDIDILASTAYANAGVYIDGKGPYVGPNSLNGPLSGLYYTVNGEWVQLVDVTFSSERHYVGGRGGHWATNWTVESGSVVLP